MRISTKKCFNTIPIPTPILPCFVLFHILIQSASVPLHDMRTFMNETAKK